MSHSGKKRPRPAHADPGRESPANRAREEPSNDIPLIAYRQMRACLAHCALRAADELQAGAEEIRGWARM